MAQNETTAKLLDDGGGGSMEKEGEQRDKGYPKSSKWGGGGRQRITRPVCFLIFALGTYLLARDVSMLKHSRDCSLEYIELDEWI